MFRIVFVLGVGYVLGAKLVDAATNRSPAPTGPSPRIRPPRPCWTPGGENWPTGYPPRSGVGEADGDRCGDHRAGTSRRRDRREALAHRDVPGLTREQRAGIDAVAAHGDARAAETEAPRRCHRSSSRTGTCRPLCSRTTPGMQAGPAPSSGIRRPRMPPAVPRRRPPQTRPPGPHA